MSSKYALISHINAFGVPANIPCSYYFRNGHTYIISEGSRRYKEYIDSQVFYNGNDFTAIRLFPRSSASAILLISLVVRNLDEYKKLARKEDEL